jgi:hypothetical protein
LIDDYYRGGFAAPPTSYLVRVDPRQCARLSDDASIDITLNQNATVYLDESLWAGVPELWCE